MNCKDCLRQCEYKSDDKIPCEYCIYEKEKVSSDICTACIEEECKFKKVIVKSTNIREEE